MGTAGWAGQGRGSTGTWQGQGPKDGHRGRKMGDVDLVGLESCGMGMGQGWGHHRDRDCSMEHSKGKG